VRRRNGCLPARRARWNRRGSAIALYAGIDGGQSSTIAALGDEQTLLARGSGPPADLVGEARDSKRQIDALAAALRAALEAAHLPPDTRVRALVAGISGFDGGYSSVPRLEALAERSQVVHDTVIAHAGALSGAAGIVVIAGTGSVALGNAAFGSPFVRCGGWGYFFGDEGSAVWIARSALRCAMQREDRGEASVLCDRAFAFYGTNSLRAIAHAFAHGEISRPALAAFAGDVLTCANEGDRDARSVRDGAANELAELTATVDRRLGATSLRLVSRAGGLFRDDAFAAAFGDALTNALPHANLVEPAHDPALGALALARKLT
jgi:N-acetylglucosamine kinase-like BadF-type ATPase